MRTRRQKILLGALALVAFCLALEIKAYVQVLLGAPPAFLGKLGRPVNRVLLTGGTSRYDADAGYLWTPGELRLMRVRHDTVLFDTRFRVNHSGFPVARDFTDDAAPRVALVGDSATAAIFLDRPWFTAAESHAGRGLASGFAIDSYANDGFGLGNWWGVYRRWIRDRDRYRHLVVASSGNSDQRGFMAATSKPDGHYYAILDRPGARLDEAPLHRTIEYASPDEMDALKSQVARASLPPLGLWATPIFLARMTAWWTAIFGRLAHAEPRASELSLVALLEDAREHGKSVSLVVIPSAEPFADYLAGKIPEELKRLRETAEQSRAELVDGYRLLKEAVLAARISPAELWLRGDPHWGQKGSDLFAAQLAREGYLKRWENALHR